MTYVAGVGISRSDDPEAISLNQLVFQAAEAALEDAQLSRTDIDGVCLAASDQLDARAISSMQLAGPAGGFLRDEIKVSDDGALALATAVMRIEAGLDDHVLAVSWTKSSESPLDAAVGVNPEPVFARPVGLHPWVGEAIDASMFLRRHGLDTDRFDELGRRLQGDRMVTSGPMCWPLRLEHVPPPTDTAVALVVTREKTPVRITGVAWASEQAEPPWRRETGEQAVATVARQAFSRADIAITAMTPIETTDRNPFRLCMSVVGLGLSRPDSVADDLVEGRVQGVNISGGLWASNPFFAAGLERVVHAVRHVRNGADVAVAHSSYGYAGQGQFVSVLGRDR